MTGRLRAGSLCSGYGGLSLAVEQFFDAETIWFSEFEEAPSRILEHHWPGVPNLGDMTKIDWATVPKVDILEGGTPCQDLSGAGKRQGMTEGTRSNLWVQMREAIAIIRPQIVCWENVRGAYSAYAYSEVESEPGLLGEYGTDRPALRALGRVLGDLSSLGYDASWVAVRASDVGAAHARYRVFVIAVDANTAGFGHEWAGGTRNGRTGFADGGDEALASLSLFPTPKASDGEFATPRTSGRPIEKTTHLTTITTLLPTPTTQDGANTGGPSQLERNTLPLNTEVTLFPTPQAHDAQQGKTADQVLAMQARGHGVSNLNETVENLLPTPRASRGASNTETLYALGDVREDDGDKQGNVTIEPAFPTTSVAEYEALWDSLEDQAPFWITEKGVDYWPAIDRWSQVIGRPSPSPTLPDGKDGRHRLNKRFAEWLMGCADGWLTDPQIWAGLGWSDSKIRNAVLKAAGNGVVTLQAITALGIAWANLEDVRWAA